MEIPFAGGCACGAIRYECTAEPIMALNCHCRDCQRASGTAYASGIFVPASADAESEGSSVLRNLPECEILNVHD
jgi:hypothetical protein